MPFSIGHDLAVMSLCNHTILTYGTFSHWAGFLAGGSRVLPMHFPEYRFEKKLVGVWREPPLCRRMKKLCGLFAELVERGAGGPSCDTRWSTRFPDCNTFNNAL